MNLTQINDQAKPNRVLTFFLSAIAINLAMLVRAIFLMFFWNLLPDFLPAITYLQAICITYLAELLVQRQITKPAD